MQNKNKKVLNIALVGNPNSGKSTLFNALTGLNQNTGNFPGVTVDKKIGSARISSHPGGEVIDARFIDLPGAYSLHPKSIDERVAFEVLCNSSNVDFPDITIIVIDGSNLKRSLFLASQIIDLKMPVVLALNMMDMVKQQGIEINVPLLSKKLSVPIVPINARKKQGIENLKQLLLQPLSNNSEKFLKNSFINVSEINKSKLQATETIERYKVIDDLLEQCVKTNKPLKEESFTNKLDKILTHKIGGYLIFLSVLFLIFQTIFFLAAYPM